MKKAAILDIAIALLFAFSGGFCDVYTLLFRGGVYANMQTGNLVKWCISLVYGTFEIWFFLPIVSFLLGILIAYLAKKVRFHGEAMLVFLILVTAVSGFLPIENGWSIVCVCLLSVAGAMQFEGFHECLSTTYTSTMCTNNMRLLVIDGVEFMKDRKNKTVFLILSVIASFVLGAFVSALVGERMETYGISILAGVYLIVLVLYVILERKKRSAGASLQ